MAKPGGTDKAERRHLSVRRGPIDHAPETGLAGGPARLYHRPDPDDTRRLRARRPALQPKTHTIELDGLRALAVWSVMLLHAGAPLFEGGWIGVDVFFVLSGFLITTLLRREAARRGRIGVGAFLYRRALRLLPAYLLYIAAITALFLWSEARDPSFRSLRWSAGEYLASLWTYTQNYTFKEVGWTYHKLTTHLWSLSVEQQFYVVLPLVLIAGLRLAGARGPTPALLLLLAVFVWISSARLLPGPPDFVLYTRGISLIAGCLAASLAFDLKDRLDAAPGRVGALHRAAIVAAAAAAAVVFWQSATGGEEGTSVALYALWAASAVAVAGWWYGWSGTLSGVLTLRPLAFTGMISYGIYLYHKLAWHLTFVTFLPDPITGARVPDYGLKLAVYGALSYAMAWASFVWLERPFLRMKAAARRTDRAQLSGERP